MHSQNTAKVEQSPGFLTYLPSYLVYLLINRFLKWGRYKWEEDLRMEESALPLISVTMENLN